MNTVEDILLDQTEANAEEYKKWLDLFLEANEAGAVQDSPQTKYDCYYNKRIEAYPVTSVLYGGGVPTMIYLESDLNNILIEEPWTDSMEGISESATITIHGRHNLTRKHMGHFVKNPNELEIDGFEHELETLMDLAEDLDGKSHPLVNFNGQSFYLSGYNIQNSSEKDGYCTYKRTSLVSPEFETVFFMDATGYKFDFNLKFLPIYRIREKSQASYPNKPKVTYSVTKGLMHVTPTD